VKATVAKDGEGRRKREARPESENVEEMVGNGVRKEGKNYDGLLLCKHRSSFHLADMRLPPPPPPLPPPPRS